jgi:nucleoside-diphosphate-sugar epimerase
LFAPAISSGRSVANNRFSQALVKPGRPVSTITYPGAPDIGHQWSYLPAVTETIGRLLERSADLESFAVFHMEGHWDAGGTQMIDAIRRNAANPLIRVARTPWRLMRLLSPFVPLFRKLAEERYLWNTPVRMDGTRLMSVLGGEPHTPLDEAVRTTLFGLGSPPCER